MRAEIITIGTELLMGMIVDTNSAEISQLLNELGIGTYYHQTIGDNPERMLEALELSTSRSDLIIISGGLGPTRDDLTKEIVAQYLNESLIVYEPAYQKIKNFFEPIDREITELDYKQALVINNGTSIFNEVGLAAGFGYAFKKDNIEKHIIVLPGVPYELRSMLETGVRPYLMKHIVNDTVIESLYLQFSGRGEALVARDLDDLIENQTNPTIAIYANPGKITVRLTASGNNRLEVDKLNKDLAEIILGRLDKYFIGYGQHIEIEDTIVQLMIDNNHTLSAAESLTAGAFMGTIANVSGASKALFGGMVTYDTLSKTQLLDIPTSIIEDYGVVSAKVAEAMADQIKKKTNTSFGLGLTGVAGPEKWDKHNVGEVYIGISYPDGSSQTVYKQYGHQPRDVVRTRAIREALNLIHSYYL